MFQSGAEAKLRRGVNVITRLLSPSDDEHKRRQLVQLAIINGTYRFDFRIFEKKLLAGIQKI